MVIAGLEPLGERDARPGAGSLQQLGLELGIEEGIVGAGIDQQLGQAGAVLDQRDGVMGAPPRPVGAEISAQRLLAPGHPAGRGDRRKGGDGAEAARIAQADGELRFVSNDGLVSIRVDDAHANDVKPALGVPTTLGIRPQAMALAKTEQPGRTIRAAVSVIELLGDQMDVTCQVGELTLIARVRAEAGLAPGDEVHLAVESERMHYFQPGEFGASLLGADRAAVTA